MPTTIVEYDQSPSHPCLLQKRPTGVDARPRGDNVKSATISLSSSSSPTSTTTLSSSSTTVVSSKAPTAPPAVSKAAAPTSGTGSVPISPHAPVLERLQPVSSSAPSRQPPSVPPRNGSRLEHSSPANNPTTISSTPTTLSQPVISPVVTSKKEESVDVPDKGSSSYREAWKASKSEQNSLVFNFVGAKKDVSHIENDGLDLSSRAKSQGKVRISTKCHIWSRIAGVKDKDQGCKNNQRRSLRPGQHKGGRPRSGGWWPEVARHIISDPQHTAGTFRGLVTLGPASRHWQGEKTPSACDRGRSGQFWAVRPAILPLGRNMTLSVDCPIM